MFNFNTSAYDRFCTQFLNPANGETDVEARAKSEDGSDNVTFSKNANDGITRWFNRTFSKPNATNSELKALSARFYRTVTAIFYNKAIPPSVLEALGVHDSSEGKMRPLSVRCIRRVAEAIERVRPRQSSSANPRESVSADQRTSVVPQQTNTVRSFYEYVRPHEEADKALDDFLMGLRFQPQSSADRNQALAKAVQNSVGLFLWSSGHLGEDNGLQSNLNDLFAKFEDSFKNGSEGGVGKAAPADRFRDLLRQVKDFMVGVGVDKGAAEWLVKDIGNKTMPMLGDDKPKTEAKPVKKMNSAKPQTEAGPLTKMKHFKTSGNAKTMAKPAKTELDLKAITEEVSEEDEDAPRLQKGAVHHQTVGSNTCFAWSLVNGMAASDKLRNHFESLIDRENGTIKVYTPNGRKELSLADKQGVSDEVDDYICRHTQDPFERFVVRYCYMNDDNYKKDFEFYKPLNQMPMGNEAFMASTFGLVESRPAVRVVPDGKMETLELDSKTKSEDAEKMIRSQVNDGGLVIVNKNSIHFVSITGIDGDGKNISVADSLGSPKPTDSSFLTIQNNISQDQVADINSLVTLSFFDLPTAEGIDGAKEYVRNSLTFDSVSDYFLNAISENQRQVSRAEKSLGSSYTISQARTKRNAEQDPERKKLLSTIVDSRLNIANYTSTLQLLVSDIQTFEAAKEEFVNNLGDSTGGRGEAARFVQLGGSETEEGRNHLDLCFKGFLSLKARELQK